MANILSTPNDFNEDPGNYELEFKDENEKIPAKMIGEIVEE